MALGAELSARALVPAPALVGAGPLGWTMKPNLVDHLVDQADPQLDFHVSTNGDGLRTGLARRSVGRRVATLGESTVFGWGLPPQDAPAGVLQELLGPDWEVLNAGQPGYSSEQGQRLARALLPLYDPQVVVWFHPWNDLAPAKATDRDLLPRVAHSTWWRRSRLLSWIASPIRSAGSALQDNPLMPLRYDGPGDTLRVPRDQRAENLESLAEAAGSERVLVVLLPNDATATQGGSSPLALELRDSCERLGVRWLDLSGTLTPADLAPLTLPGDPGHFNRAGNERLMAPVAAALTGGFVKDL